MSFVCDQKHRGTKTTTSFPSCRFDRNFGEAPAWERRPPSTAAAIAAAAAAAAAASLPRPLDLCVPADKAIVAITGGYMRNSYVCV